MPNDTISIRFGFPGLDGPRANKSAESLLSDLKSSAILAQHLRRDETHVARTDRESMDFGTILIAVLGTQAVILLAEAVKSWVERTGTTTIEVNGLRIENVHSKDVAAIVKAIQARPAPDE